MNLRDQFNLMSWLLLEYEVIYFLSSNHFIDENWLELRKISDETYDKKLKEYKRIGKKLKLSTERPVGCSADRASVKLVLGKFKSPPFDYFRVPLVWPDFATETDEELAVRTYLETEDEELIDEKVG